MSADDPRPDFPLPGPDLALHRLIDAIRNLLRAVEDDNKLFTMYGNDRSLGLREFDRAADRLEEALQAPLGDCNANYRSVIKSSVERLRDNRSSGTGWDVRALEGLKRVRAVLESLLVRRQAELPTVDRSRDGLGKLIHKQFLMNTPLKAIATQINKLAIWGIGWDVGRVSTELTRWCKRNHIKRPRRKQRRNRQK
jgi:hypothetical protein